MKIRMDRILPASALLITLFWHALPPPLHGEGPPRKIIVAGAQSIAPLAEKFSVRFRNDHPGVEVEVRGANSNYAIGAVRRGEIHVGLVARSLSATEKSGLRLELMGHDAMVLLSYPRNSVADLTLDQLRNIYLGKITNWREIGGEDDGIVPLTREKDSALRSIFMDRLFGKGFNGSEKAFSLRASKDKILRTIKRVRGSLGYGIVRAEEAQSQGIKVLAVNGRLPTAANLRDGLYHFARPQLLIARADANGIVREWMGEFVKFAQRGADPEVPR